MKYALFSEVPRLFAKRHFLLSIVATGVFLIGIAFIFSMYVRAEAASGVPTIVSYQGRLTDGSSNLLGGSGTTFYFKFSIWDNVTVGSGTRLWPADEPATTTATVREGVFAVDIGDTAGGDPDTLDFDFNSSQDIYLQVEVSSDNNSSQTLSPRQRIAAAAFAELASAVSGTTASAFGTTTPLANTVVSIEATSTSAVPLAIRAFASQLADIFQIQNSAGTSLFSVNASGDVLASKASTTLLSVSSDGTATTTIVGDSATSTFSGGIQVTGSLDVQSATASSTFANGLIVNGGSLQLLQMLSCTGANTLKTDVSGNLICATDEVGTGALNWGQTWEINVAGYLAPTSSITTLLDNGLVSAASSTFVSNVDVGGSLGASSTLAVDGTATFGSLLSGLTASFTGGLSRQNETLQLTASADALTPTSTTVGLITSASSTIGGDFTVVGNATTTGLLEVGGSGTSTITNGGLAVSTLDVQSTTASSTFGNGLVVSNGSLQLLQTLGCNGNKVLETDVSGNLQCGADDTGGSGSLTRGQTWEINAAGQLAPTTTIDVLLPQNGYVSGNFGIGTTTTYSPLSVWNDALSAVGKTLFEITNHASTTLFSVDDSGTLTTSGLVSNASSTFVSNVEVGGSLGASSTLAVDGVATFSSLLSGLTGAFAGGLTRQNETWSIDASGNLTTTTTLPVLIPGSLTVTQNLTRGNETLQLTAAADALTPTTSVGIITSASSTIGGGLTVGGNATTTGIIEVGGSGTSTITNGGLAVSTLDVQSTTASSTFGNGLLVSTGSLQLLQTLGCNGNKVLETDVSGNLQCGADDTGGSGSLTWGQTWEINAAGQLAPTTTIDVLLPQNGYVSGNFGIGTTTTYSP